MHPFWQKKLKIEATLGDGPIFITSIEDGLPEMIGGVVVEAARGVAAHRIAAKTHRLATDEEIAAFKQEQDRRAQELRVQEERKKERSTLVLSAELAQQLGVVAASEPRASKKG